VLVCVSVSAELIEQEGQIVFYEPDVSFEPSLLEVVGGCRVFDDGAVAVILAARRRAQPPQRDC
jgi:hypothetical protein